MITKRLQSLLSVAAMAMLALGMVACGNKTGEGSSNGDSLSVSTAQTPSDAQHSAEFITLRIDTIYRLRNNERCCSERYMALFNKARQLSEEDGTLFIESDHWIAGQDMDEEFSYELMSVTNITDSTAQATMNIHNYVDQKVVLDLVFERGTWFVDNFHFFFEGSDYDSDGNSIPGSEGMKETDEVKEMQKYIQQLAKHTELPLMVRHTPARHMKRMTDGVCDVANGVQYENILMHLERIADQCSDLAVSHLGRYDERVRGREHQYIHNLHTSNDPDYMTWFHSCYTKYYSLLDSIGAEEAGDNYTVSPADEEREPE